MDEADDVIQEFLGDNPRAAEWRAMRDALNDRLRAFKRQFEVTEDDRECVRLAAQIEQVERQLTAIETEVAVTQFVEDSIKVSLARPGVWRDEDEEGAE